MMSKNFLKQVAILFDIAVAPTDVDELEGKEVIVVQAKRYKRTVGIKAVQEVIPAVKMYNAWVVSNSYYTKAAVKLAKHNGVRMIDREELIQMSKNVSKSNNEFTEDSMTVSEEIKISAVVGIESPQRIYLIMT